MIGKRFLKSSTAVAIVFSSVLFLAACATDPGKTGSVGRNGTQSIDRMSVPELERTAAMLGRRYDKKPRDKANGLTFANVLRSLGRNEQALAVMQQMAIRHPEDNDVLAAYGKALAGAGNLKKALKIIERAQRPDRPDWRLFSAEGAILDQLGQPKDARLRYRKALDIVPNEPSVLSNLGMSYVLEGDVRSAETYLRRAIAQPNADSRVRQNLALVVGLQGDFQEAETIARGELPEAEAQQNIAFLRKMLSQQNAWNLLKNTDKQTQ